MFLIMSIIIFLGSSVYLHASCHFPLKTLTVYVAKVSQRCGQLCEYFAITGVWHHISALALWSLVTMLCSVWPQ